MLGHIILCIRPLQVVVLFVVRASPKSRGGWAGFTIIVIITLPQKFTLNRIYHNLFNTCTSIYTTLKGHYTNKTLVHNIQRILPQLFNTCEPVNTDHGAVTSILNGILTQVPKHCSSVMLILMSLLKLSFMHHETYVESSCVVHRYTSLLCLRPKLPFVTRYRCTW